MPTITIANSTITNGSTAFASAIPNSTLTVNANAYLVSLNGGNGADITGFTAATVNGLVAAYGANSIGLQTSEGGTNDAMALTIGATGEIYGADDGLFNDQTIAINNAGILEGAVKAGIYESYSNAGASSLTNAASGQVIGAVYGLYSYGAGFDIGESVANSGLIEGQTEAGIYLQEEAATKISNAASGRIVGYNGVVVTQSSGAQHVVNAGLIEGSDNVAIEIDSTGGALVISNAATGAISGEIGISDNAAVASARTIANAGAIVGVGGDAIVETSSGPFTLTNAATGRIFGRDDGVDDDGATGNRTINNSGLIHGASDGVFEATAGINSIDNLSGAQIIGGGPSGYGIYDGAASGAQTIINAGLLAGGEYALYTGSSTTVHFVNSGIVKGDVDLTGDDVVRLTGGKVIGNIDMSASDTAEKFVATGGVVTGEVLFGNGVGNTATIGAGVAAIDFVLDAGNATNTLIYKAATSSTATNLDKISNWESPDDMIDLSAFASNKSFANISQTNVAGDDIISLTGTSFKMELVGVNSKLDSSSFTF